LHLKHRIAPYHLVGSRCPWEIAQIKQRPITIITGSMDFSRAVLTQAYRDPFEEDRQEAERVEAV
jgi:hypothetical protein